MVNDHEDRRVEDWEGLRELDRAISENRLTAYSWKKAWADPWNRAGLLFFGIVFTAFVIFVIIYDGLL